MAARRSSHHTRSRLGVTGRGGGAGAAGGTRWGRLTGGGGAGSNGPPGPSDPRSAGGGGHRAARRRAQAARRRWRRPHRRDRGRGSVPDRWRGCAGGGGPGGGGHGPGGGGPPRRQIVHQGAVRGRVQQPPVEGALEVVLDLGGGLAHRRGRGGRRRGRGAAGGAARRCRQIDAFDAVRHHPGGPLGAVPPTLGEATRRISVPTRNCTHDWNVRVAPDPKQGTRTIFVVFGGSVTRNRPRL